MKPFLLFKSKKKPMENHNYKTFKSFSFYEQSYNKDTTKYISDNFIIKKIRYKKNYTVNYDNKKIFTYDSDSTSTLIEQFDENFILISVILAAQEEKQSPAIKNKLPRAILLF